MAKKVKLTEADLNRIVKKVIEEQGVIQNAANYANNAIKSGANAINNATGGVAGKVAKSFVDTAKSVGNALTANSVSQKAQRSQGAQDRIKAQMANQKIQTLARTLKQYTPQEIAAAQKLNATGGVSPTPARPTPAKPAQTTQSLVQSAQKAAQVKQV
jgi:hypothetical protein